MNSVPADVRDVFVFEGVIKEIRPLGEGLINDTFFVETTDTTPNYILQRKNKNIFKNVPAMIENIRKVSEHLKKKIVDQGGDPLRETLTLIPITNSKYSLDQSYCYVDKNEDFWSAYLFIEETISHQSADTLYLAYQGGAGIAKFQAMLADMNDNLTDILPGFHNIKYRFGQWDDTLAKDPVGRKKSVAKEIAWIKERREEMLAFWDKVEIGEIPSRVTHNDTKINNILFDKEDNILCVIDLDTVLNSTCLNDFGDAIRSYTNAGAEDDENLDNVYVKMDIFEAYAKGYLSQASQFLLPIEIDHLAFSARYITFEQVLRFLMDYIDGDNYYKVAYPEHNLVRARAQYKLLTSIEENMEEMNRIISGLTR